MWIRNAAFCIFPVAVFIACTSANSGSDGGGNTPNGKFIIACQGDGHACTGVAEYETCLSSTCDPELKAAFGPNYRSGTIKGPCATTLQCEMACPCDRNFNGCKQKCTSNLPSDCYPALTNLIGCTFGKGCVMSCAGGAGD